MEMGEYESFIKRLRNDVITAIKTSVILTDDNK